MIALPPYIRWTDTR